jgi:hypothetical protein
MDGLLLLLIPVIALVSLALALCAAAARADALESLGHAEDRLADGVERSPTTPSVFLVDEWGQDEQLVELKPDAIEATGERLRREFQQKRRSWLAALSVTRLGAAACEPLRPDPPHEPSTSTAHRQPSVRRQTLPSRRRTSGRPHMPLMQVHVSPPARLPLPGGRLVCAA